MSDRYATLLGVSRMLIVLLRILNLVAGALLIGMFVASFVFEPVFREFFSKQPPRIDPGLLIPTLRVWMLLATADDRRGPHPLFAAAGDDRDGAGRRSVRAGECGAAEDDRLVPARRSSCLDLVCGVMAAIMNAAGSNIDWTFSANGWVAVVLVFVLARVFEEGARMRADLEAMI